MKKIADLCCKAGGAGVGYHRAGFDVVGFDIQPQLNYPFEFIQADALEIDLSEFDVIHASPPCQKYSVSSSRWRNKGYEYPDIIEPIRKKLIESGKPYIIENVIGAPLINPIVLCGAMFNLNVIRHRLFESNIKLEVPEHPAHKPPIIRPHKNNPDKMVKRSVYCSVAGHGGHGDSFKFDDWKEAMKIDWMTKLELTQAIPPAYTEYLGKQLLAIMGT